MHEKLFRYVYLFFFIFRFDFCVCLYIFSFAKKTQKATLVFSLFLFFVFCVKNVLYELIGVKKRGHIQFYTCDECVRENRIFK